MSAFEVVALIVSLVLGAAAVVVIIRGNIARKHAPEMKKRAAAAVAPLLKEFFGDDMEYQPADRIADGFLAEAQFVTGYNVIRGSDLVTGRYRGVPIQFSDVQLIEKVERRDPKTRRMKAEYTTLFRGAWIVAAFDRDLTPVPLSIESGPCNRAIMTEDVRFNQHFGIYCADPHTAFYVLTPPFMERLVEADITTNGAIYIQLHKNIVQIAVGYGGDRFELDYYKKLSPAEIEAKFRAEISEITDLLDRIMGHERLFGTLQPTSESEPG